MGVCDMLMDVLVKPGKDSEDFDVGNESLELFLKLCDMMM